MNKKYLTVEEINERLKGTRDQTFRKQSQRYIDTANNSRANNIERYYYGDYILRSPGNDLLDFYDSMMLRLDVNSKCRCPIPPSVVFDMRFRLKFPDYVEPNKYNYGKWAFLADRYRNFYDTTDNTWYAQKYNQTFKWLKDEPHKEWRFKCYNDLKDFAKNKLGITIHHGITLASTQNKSKIFTKEEMTWRGAGAGYSVVVELNEKYPHKDKLLSLEKFKMPKINKPLSEQQLSSRPGYGSGNRG